MNMKRFLKRFAFVFLSALFLFMAASCEGSVSTSDGEKPLESSGHKLVIGGLSEYVILLSDEAQENEALAATELQQILQSRYGRPAFRRIRGRIRDHGRYAADQHRQYRSCAECAGAKRQRRAGALGIHHKNSRRAAIHYGGRECARVCVRGV